MVDKTKMSCYPFRAVLRIIDCKYYFLIGYLIVYLFTFDY
jgi:hypothetical protein